MRSSDAILSLVIGAVLFSLTKLYSTSTSFSSSSSLDNAVDVVEKPDAVSPLPPIGSIASRLWTQPTSENELRKEVENLNLMKEMLELTIEELKLSHEKVARMKAINLAQGMMNERKEASLIPSIPPQSSNGLSSVSNSLIDNNNKVIDTQTIQNKNQEAKNWCHQAAKLFNLKDKVSATQQWGLMEESKYREAWVAHSCDSVVFPYTTITKTTNLNQLVKPPSSFKTPSMGVITGKTNLVGNSFVYLNDNSGNARRRITVVVWNKIRGFLDWLRPDFVKDARDKCSTECVFTDKKGELGNADGVLFHVKTHSMTDFPKKKGKPNQKYMMVSLEQPDYAPLMKNKRYTDKFDYVMTYDLDSTVPIITIHPHYTAQEYYSAPVVPWEQKKDAAVLFTSNCKNAGAETRLKYVEELMKHFEVHSYGRCLKNKDEPAKGKRSPNENKRLVLSQYKWYLAFENNIIKDYVSEKVFDGILAGAVPVYFGTPNVDKLLPSPKAVVKVSDFDSNGGPKALAQFLKETGTNKAKYESYLQWKMNPPKEEVDAFQRVIDSTGYKFTSLCRICQKLAEDSPLE